MWSPTETEQREQRGEFRPRALHTGPVDGCISPSPAGWASTDSSLFIFHSETRDKMAAGLTLMYEPRTEGKIHSADPLNLNQR